MGGGWVEGGGEEVEWKKVGVGEEKEGVYNGRWGGGGEVGGGGDEEVGVELVDDGGGFGGGWWGLRKGERVGV